MDQGHHEEPVNEKPNTWLILIFFFFIIFIAHWLAKLMSKAVCQLFGRQHTSKCNWIGWTIIFVATCTHQIYKIATYPEWMIARDGSIVGNAQIFGVLSIVGLAMSIFALMRAPRISKINSDEGTVTLDHTN